MAWIRHKDDLIVPGIRRMGGCCVSDGHLEEVGA